MDLINKFSTKDFKSSYTLENDISEKIFIIPPNRVRYLSEISEKNRNFDKILERQIQIADRLYGLNLALKELDEKDSDAYKDNS